MLRSTSKPGPLSVLGPILALTICSAPVSASRGADGGIPWFQGPHMSALGKARSEGRPLMLYFWMEGSDPCTRLFGETLAEPTVAAKLGSTLCRGIDIASLAGAKRVQEYGVVTLPTLLFLDAEGAPQDAVLGFIDAPNLLAELDRIQAGQGTVADLRAQADGAPDDLALLHRLALKLRDVGDTAGHDELVAEILERDPLGETPTGSRLAFWAARRAVLAGVPPTEVDLAPLREHLRGIRVREVRFDAWNWLAGFEYERERRPEARAAYREAWEHVPEDNELEIGMEVTRVFWEMRAELDREDKAFMLKTGRRVAERARALEELPEDFAKLEWEGETYEQLLAMALDTRAVAEYVNGNARQARALLEEAVELFPAGEEIVARLELVRDRR